MPRWRSPFGRARRLEAKVDLVQATLHVLLERIHLMATTLADLIATLKTNTDAVSARLDRLVASLQNVATPDQLAELQALSDHMAAMGTDPANPVPSLPPASPTL
jgi:hypothetical protein